MVHETAGGGHHDLRMLFQLLDLSAQTGAAVENGHPDALIEGQQAPQLIADLDGQLPGRRQNQPLHIRAGGVDMLDHGDAEGEGLAGAGGGLGDHVLPFQERRNGLLLDGGGITVALLFQRPQHGIAETQIGKGNTFLLHGIHSSFVFSFFSILSVFRQICNRQNEGNRREKV